MITEKGKVTEVVSTKMTLQKMGFERKEIITRDGARVAWVRPGPNGKAIVFVGGYCQNADTWCRYIGHAPIEVQESTIVVLERPSRSSWATYSYERREIARMFSAVKHDILGQFEHVYLVGHSMGAALCRHLVEMFPNVVANVLQICPIPDQPRSILWNWRFWTNGGFVALIAAIFTLIFRPFKGFVPPLSVVRGLFTGMNYSQNHVREYQHHLTPEGVLTFFQLTLTYSGGELTRAECHRGWHGRNVVIATSQDKIVQTIGVVRSSFTTKDGYFYWTPAAPHCLQFASDDEWHQKVIPVINLGYTRLFG